MGFVRRRTDPHPLFKIALMAIVGLAILACLYAMASSLLATVLPDFDSDGWYFAIALGVLLGCVHAADAISHWFDGEETINPRGSRVGQLDNLGLIRSLRGAPRR